MDNKLSELEQLTEQERSELIWSTEYFIKSSKAGINEASDVDVLMAEVALAALKAEKAGWKLVPVEPDWNMLSADGCKEHHEGKPCSHHDNRKRIWRAMLAAAPAPGGDDV